MDVFSAFTYCFLGILGFFAGLLLWKGTHPQKKKKENNLSPAATALGTQTKILKTRMKNLAHEAEILALEKSIQDMKYDMQDDIEEESEEDKSVDTMMIGFLGQLLQKNQPPGTNNFQGSPIPPSDFATAYTPEIKEIRDNVEKNIVPTDNEKLNKLLTSARSIPKDQLAKILKSRSAEIAEVLKE